MSEAPERIHLQWDGDCDVTMVYGEPYADEVTWSMDRIWDGDIEYVRKDKADALADAIKVFIEWPSSDTEVGVEKAIAAYRGKA